MGGGLERNMLTCPFQRALVTYVTAGYPNADDTIDIMLGMEAGGAGKFLLQLDEL